ncbi:MAG: hypothetical protein ACXVZR_03830 [Terriglobales bacterium]
MDFYTNTDSTTVQPETTNTTGIVDSIEQAGAAVLGAVEHPIATIESAASAAVAEVERGTAAVRGELEDLTAKVRTYFHSMNGGHLEEALVAIATRVQALEAVVANMRDFIGK